MLDWKFDPYNASLRYYNKRIYRVGPEFPNTSFFLLLEGEKWNYFYLFWHECVAESKSFFGAKNIMILLITVEKLLIFQSYPKLVHTAPFPYKKIQGFFRKSEPKTLVQILHFWK